MIEEFEPWLRLFRLLGSDLLSKNGAGRRILEEAELLTDDNALMLLAVMEPTFEAAREERRQRANSTSISAYSPPPRKIRR